MYKDKNNKGKMSFTEVTYNVLILHWPVFLLSPWSGDTGGSNGMHEGKYIMNIVLEGVSIMFRSKL